MFKVIISRIYPKIDSSDPIELCNEHELFEFRRMRCDFNDNAGPFLVRLMKVHKESGQEYLCRAHICYTGEGIYNFVKREIERMAISYGMRDAFN